MGDELSRGSFISKKFLQLVLYRLTDSSEVRDKNRKFSSFYHVKNIHKHCIFTTLIIQVLFSKLLLKAQAGKAQHSCYTGGNVEPLHFYEQTCEVSQWLKAAEAQPRLTSLRCHPSGIYKTLYSVHRPKADLSILAVYFVVFSCAHTTVEWIQEGFGVI